MKIVLAQDKMSVTLDDLVLKINDVITYVAADSEQASVGRIVELKHPGYKESDTESVWMAVCDVTGGMAEWVSCRVWKENKDNGMFDFESVPEKTKQTKQQQQQFTPTPFLYDTNNEQEDIQAGGDDLW